MQTYDEYQDQLFQELTARWAHLPPFVTRKQAAAILDVSYATINRLVKDGAFREGGVRRSLRLRKVDVIRHFVETFALD